MVLLPALVRNTLVRYALSMSLKTTLVASLFGLLLLAVVLLAAAWHSAFTRAQYMSMSMRPTPRHVALIVNAMTLHYAEHGQWPEPGMEIDDSMFPYVSSRANGRYRIDTYDVFVTDYQVELTLKPDGTIDALVNETER